MEVPVLDSGLIMVRTVHSRIALMACVIAVLIGLPYLILSFFDAGWLSTAFTVIAAIGVSALVWAWVRSAMLRFEQEAVNRLTAAAHGDLRTPVSAILHATFPDLAGAMENLFREAQASLDDAQIWATADPVTGLANRASFCRQVEQMMDAHAIGEPSALFFIDLDGFKAVNDSLGHAAGDQVLIGVALRLRAVVAACFDPGVPTVISRYAGDEFALYCPTLPAGVSAMTLAMALQSAFADPFVIDGTQVDVAGAIGVAYYPDHGRTLPMLLRAADHAMYDAKQTGRGKITLYSDDLAARLEGREEMERDLRLALDRNEFILEFQPQVDIAANRVVGAEVLVRWLHPRRGLLLPDAFVGLAEETGLIIDLGEWILDRVCHTAARWANDDIQQRLSINISRRELSRIDFFTRLEQAVERHATPLHMLQLELNETVLMRMNADAHARLSSLRLRGVWIAMDDFGTGFSNLGQLRDLPVDRVKIDRSLVRDIAISAEARTICAAIIGLVRGLGQAVVVEGVENAEQIDILRAMGCTVFQGFYLCRPVREQVYLHRFTDKADSAALA